MSVLHCRLLLFDLDGTLVDTAPDLHAAAAALAARRGVPAVPYGEFRPLVSRGGTAMLQRTFPAAGSDELAALLPEFLDAYAAAIAERSALFPGISELLAALDASAVRWGVVTNKPESLSQSLLAALQLETRCAVLIGGDTLDVRKPDPAPLREACRRLGEPIATTVYVGDDPRDILAARAAGMRSVAAAWGYAESGADLSAWGADRIVASVVELGDLCLPAGVAAHG